MLNIVPSVEELTSPSSKIIERCSICNKLFKGNSALKTHMKRSHKEQHVSLMSCPSIRYQ